MTKKSFALIGAILFAGLITACGVAEAGESPTTSVRETSTTEAPTTTTTMPTTTTTMPATTTTATTSEDSAELTTRDEFNPDVFAYEGEFLTQDNIDLLAEPICQAFEVVYLSEIVEAMQATPGQTGVIPTEDALFMTGLAINVHCSKQGAEWFEELEVEYPEHAEYVSSQIVMMLESWEG